ncbi:hypothetical protein [uncultured Anaerococcus sp.]|uniref:hypothetical protein n=1 Tax=uncultured Anaerococcus sp. TaxID=293428 RepID=UPI00261D353E|nr:hypothetical protein [uncultured Anaerococcus sp.]
MKFVYTQKAKDYIKKNNINKLYIREDIERGMGCCDLGSISLKISQKSNNEEKLKKDISDLVTTYYDPKLEALLMNYPEVEISVFGLGRKKMFFTVTEFSPLNS